MNLPHSPRARLALLGGLLCACATTGDAQFQVQRAPTLGHGDDTLAIFGVFKSGRMNTLFWEDAGADIISAVVAAKDHCEPAYGERLQKEAPHLYAHIDEDTQDNGITPELLEQLTAHAPGSLILSMEVLGKLPSERPSRSNTQPSPQSQAQSPSMGRGMGRSRMGGMPNAMGTGRRHDPSDDNALDMTLSLYSPKSHDFVAKVAMHYTGTSMEDAVRSFTQKLQTTLPKLPCSPWRWEEP